jgi:hypothetical protein
VTPSVLSLLSCSVTGVFKNLAGRVSTGCPGTMQNCKVRPRNRNFNERIILSEQKWVHLYERYSPALSDNDVNNLFILL